MGDLVAIGKAQLAKYERARQASARLQTPADLERLVPVGSVWTHRWGTRVQRARIERHRWEAPVRVQVFIRRLDDEDLKPTRLNYWIGASTILAEWERES